MVKRLRYGDVEPGLDLGVYEYTITPEQVRAYAASLGDQTAWYDQDSPFGGPIAPAGFLANDYVKLIASQYEFVGGVHAKQENTYLNPARPGRRIRVTGQVVDKYERRGKLWIVVETTTTDETGLTLARSRNTLMMPAPDQEPNGSEPAGSREPGGAS